MAYPFSPALRRLLAVVALMLSWGIVPGSARTGLGKLDSILRSRALASTGQSRVIVRVSKRDTLEATVRGVGGTTLRRLSDARSDVVLVPNAGLASLASHPDVLAVSVDRAVAGTMDGSADPRADAAWISDTLGIDGTGIGVATIDSGVNASHDDLGASRIVHWADFVTRTAVPYDDYGHGTHVAGIIAGTGVNSSGARRGLAPGASLVVLKALDGTGNGRVSDVIEALDYAVANRARFNIKVINLSVAARVYESYRTDPLTQAALRAVRAGIVVVAAAGNLGVNAAGEPQAGGITAPGNAPWVLTVGASSGLGTAGPDDDVVAAFSSRGPSAIDLTPKPDLVAPGVGIESAADPASTLFSLQPRARVWGSARTVSQPYLRLSGTSMAAPVVAGTVALMLQADPHLTPNAVKAILQFTAEPRRGVDETAQGAGLLNTRGAVALARALATGAGGAPRLEALAGGTRSWSRRIIWGPQHLAGETLPADLPAWDARVPWGADVTAAGEPIAWPGLCAVERAVCEGR